MSMTAALADLMIALPIRPTQQMNVDVRRDGERFGYSAPTPIKQRVFLATPVHPDTLEARSTVQLAGEIRTAIGDIGII